jgi:hypothetical protein
MPKITLSNVGSLIDTTTAAATINSNFATVQTAFDNTLSRDGTQPNPMESNIDMNSNRILNLPVPVSLNEPVRLGDINQDTTIVSFAQIAGTLTPSQLPLPTATTIGGVESYTAPAHQWINSISTAGVVSSSQPNYTDLAGTPPLAVLFVTAYDTRASAIAATVAGTVEFISLRGWTTANDGGGGNYIRLNSAPSTVRSWHLQSADGTFWQLQTSIIYPRQVGAVLDGVTDDSTPIQDWADYSATFGVIARDQTGVALIPTETINLASNTTIQGSNILTLKKNSQVVAPLLQGLNSNNIRVCGINLNTTSGFTSTSSNSISNTTQTFTVPAGLVGLVVGQFIQICAANAPINYMITQIVSYSGTTLVVLGTTSVGSGTFSSWLLDSYPLNGNLAAVNSAIKVTTCVDVWIENLRISGRFYNGIDVRNTNNCYITDNIINGQVNRGISPQSYTFGMTNIVITGNAVIGNISQYGILCSATASGSLSQLRIFGNSVQATLFQGISMGGAISNSQISGNTVSLSPTGTVATCILVDLSDGFNPQFISVTGNSTFGGQFGVLVTQGFYVSVTGNVCVGTSSDGYNISSSIGVTLTGNIAEACGGWGFNGSTSSTTIVGCQAIACSLGTYNISGAVAAGNI